MNKFWSRSLAALGAVLVLGAVNFSIAGKKRIKRDGEVVYLALAPVDPRSLMQGDYMTLRFALVQALERGSTASAGDTAMREGSTAYAILDVASNRVATLAIASAPAQLKLRYRIRNGDVWLGTNAFFFEEGSAARYGGASYGEFRVDRDTGEAVLVGLRDQNLKGL